MMLPNEKSFLFITVTVIWMHACKTDKIKEFKDKAFSILKQEYTAYYWGKFDQIRHC